MKCRIAKLTVAFCVLAIATTGCATVPAPAAPKRVVIAGQAQLDIASDTAIFPLDYYRGKNRLDFANAENLATQDCMKASGHNWENMPYTTLGNNDWRLFGLWNAPLAAQYGYDSPPDPEMAESNKLNNGELSKAKRAAFDGCLATTKKLFPRPDSRADSSGYSLSGEAFYSTMEDPDAQKLFTIWEKCMLTHGVSVNVKKSGVLMAYVDMKTMPLEQQLRTAVNEVQCKTDNNIVQQLADIDASYQVVLIAQNQAALNKELALNKKTDAAVAKYLATHG